jgi:hypothetical protein
MSALLAGGWRAGTCALGAWALRAGIGTWGRGTRRVHFGFGSRRRRRRRSVILPLTTGTFCIRILAGPIAVVIPTVFPFGLVLLRSLTVTLAFVLCGAGGRRRVITVHFEYGWRLFTGCGLRGRGYCAWR